MDGQKPIFTKAEVSTLTKLSIKQLDLLRQRNCIVPQETPVRYSWNQLIECSIFYCLREKFSWRQSADYIMRYRNTMTFDKGFKHGDTLVIQPNKGFVVKKAIDVSTITNGDLIMEVTYNQPVETLLAIKKQEDGSLLVEDLVQDETVTIYVSNIIKQLWDVAKNEKVKNFAQKAYLKPLNFAA